ncbi:MAG: AtpZ/AtpI family protein, partial [bacterium]
LPVELLVLPVQMGFSVVIFLLLGYFLDRITGKSPIFTLTGLGFAILSVFWTIYTLVAKSGR